MFSFPKPPKCKCRGCDYIERAGITDGMRMLRNSRYQKICPKCGDVMFVIENAKSWEAMADQERVKRGIPTEAEQEEVILKEEAACKIQENDFEKKDDVCRTQEDVVSKKETSLTIAKIEKEKVLQSFIQENLSLSWEKGSWPQSKLTNADMLKEVRGCLWDDYDLEGGEFRIADKPLYIHMTEESSVTVHGNTGDTVWCAAFVLAKYLEHTWPTFKGSQSKLNVIEIGAGAGLAGIAAASLGGARQVVLTDLEYCHKALQLSAKHCLDAWKESSTFQTTIEVQLIDWFQADDLLPKKDEEEQKQDISGSEKKQSWLDSCDLILGAGVFWLNHLLIPCVRTLEALTLLNPHAVVLISYQSRCEHYDDDLFDALNRSFDCYVIPRAGQHPDFNLEKIHLLALRRKVDAPSSLHPLPMKGSHLDE
eukprot:g3080.t1